MVVKYITMRKLEKFYTMVGVEQDNGVDLMEIIKKGQL